MNYSVKIDPDFLEHHGVEGQEWGKRNGPPYPLNKAGKEALSDAVEATNLWENVFKSDKAKDGAAKYMFDGNEDRQPSYKKLGTRDNYKKQLELESIRVVDGTTYEVTFYSDADSHWIVGEGDVKNGKIKRWSMEG